METVTIKALTNLGTSDYPECPIQEGEMADVSPDVAAKLVANRHGVIVDLPLSTAEQDDTKPEETKPDPKPTEAKEPAKNTTKPNAKK